MIAQVIAEVWPYLAFIASLLITAAIVIWSDSRTQPPDTSLRDEIAQRAEVLRASRDEGARTIVELHRRGAQLSASIAKRGLRS